MDERLSGVRGTDTTEDGARLTERGERDVATQHDTDSDHQNSKRGRGLSVE
jgi:hypothetical protein